MKSFFKRKPKPTPAGLIADFFDECQSWREKEDNLEPLIELIRLLRPLKTKNLEIIDLQEIISFLKENYSCRKQFSIYIKEILKDKRFNKILSDAAIFQDVDFIFEAKKRIFAKILPYQPQKDTLEYILNQVFYLANDAVWINKIPSGQLEELYRLLKFKSIYESTEPNSVLSELLFAMYLITQRISGRAMETDVINMLP